MDNRRGDTLHRMAHNSECVRLFVASMSLSAKTWTILRTSERGLFNTTSNM
jgi:hypothetical protein